MQIFDQEKMKKLSFPDYDVEKIVFFPEEKKLNISVEGAFMTAGDGCVGDGFLLGKGILYFYDWESISFCSFNSNKCKVDKSPIERLKDLCQVKFTDSIVILAGFGIKIGDWMEWEIYKPKMHAEFDLITADHCLKLILEKFPAFQPSWLSFKSENKNDISFWTAMGDFSHYVSDLLIKNELGPMQTNGIFAFIEFLLNSGDDDVQNAICTCFIENILNRTPETIDPKLFVKHLGPKSREYALAWDEFTGVNTEGLKG